MPKTNGDFGAVRTASRNGVEALKSNISALMRVPGKFFEELPKL